MSKLCNGFVVGGETVEIGKAASATYDSEGNNIASAFDGLGQRIDDITSNTLNIAHTITEETSTTDIPDVGAITSYITGSNYDTIARDIMAYCSTDGDNADKSAVLTDFAYRTGSVVRLCYSVSNTAQSKLRLQINNRGFKDIYLMTGDNTWTVTSPSNCTLPNAVYDCYYNGTNWYLQKANLSSGRSTDHALLFEQAAYTTKSVFVNGFKLVPGTCFKMYVDTANTAANALKLNVNLLGEKPLYVNNFPTSVTNYDLPTGWYVVLYDGEKFCVNNSVGFIFPAALKDGLGNIISDTYATKNEVSGYVSEAPIDTEQYVRKNGDWSVAEVGTTDSALSNDEVDDIWNKD